jgi:hypothetical protein
LEYFAVSWYILPVLVGCAAKILATLEKTLKVLDRPEKEKELFFDAKPSFFTLFMTANLFYLQE